MKPIRYLIHRIAHLTQWNHGNVESYWEDGYLMVAFRCACGERQGAHRVAHNGCFISEPKCLPNPQAVIYQNTNFMDELSASDGAVKELVYSGDEVTVVHCSWSPAGLVHEHKTKFSADRFQPSCLDPKFRLKA